MHSGVLMLIGGELKPFSSTLKAGLLSLPDDIWGVPVSLPVHVFIFWLKKLANQAVFDCLLLGVDSLSA